MVITKGKILKKYRKKMEMSQNRLSKLSGVPRGTISACELRNSTIDRKMAEIYDKLFAVKKSLIQRILDWF